MFKLASRAIKLALATAALTLSALSLNAQAAYTSYTANGVNLVSLIQWAGTKDEYSYTTTQDANLFGTMAAAAGDADKDGVNDLVEAILAVSPTVTDGFGTSLTVRASSFSTGYGDYTYAGSLAFMNYLNSISYAGSNQWYLGDAFGVNVFLYSGELINIKGLYRVGNYWLADGNEPYLPVLDMYNVGWSDEDLRDYRNYSSYFFSIFMTKGTIADVSAVPAPAAAWLFATGLPVVGAFVRRRKQQA